jgi:toluene monooxygenase system ferredoxin subunit
MDRSVIAENGTWQVVATLDDVWEGEHKAVNVKGMAILLINVGGEIRAYDDHCPHSGSPLSNGTLKGEILTCSAHEWMFDCRFGHGINPRDARLRPIPIRVEGEEILVNSDPVR